MKGGGVEWGGIGEVLYESLTRRLTTLSEKKKNMKKKMQQEMVLVNGTEVVYVR